MKGQLSEVSGEEEEVALLESSVRRLPTVHTEQFPCLTFECVHEGDVLFGSDAADLSKETGGVEVGFGRLQDRK